MNKSNEIFNKKNNYLNKLEKDKSKEEGVSISKEDKLSFLKSVVNKIKLKKILLLTNMVFFSILLFIEGLRRMDIIHIQFSSTKFNFSILSILIFYIICLLYSLKIILLINYFGKVLVEKIKDIDFQTEEYIAFLYKETKKAMGQMNRDILFNIGLFFVILLAYLSNFI